MISVKRSGEICNFDFKWHGSDTSISPSGRAYQAKRSLEGVLRHTLDGIDAAKSGRLPPEAAARVQENVDKGNVTIVTVGTGSARNGVIERIVGGEREVIRPKRRP